MKTKIKILVLLLMVTGLTFTACKKEDENTDTGSSDNKITLKIDNDAEITYTDITAMVLDNKIVIGCQNSDSDMEIIVDKDISAGTYNQQDIGMTYGVNSVAVFGSLTNVTSLSFVVSNHDTTTHHIQGTFTLSYDDNNSGAPHTATGTFNVYYTGI